MSRSSYDSLPRNKNNSSCETESTSRVRKSGTLEAVRSIYTVECLFCCQGIEMGIRDKVDHLNY